LPWGDPVEQKHHWWEFGHWAKSFLWDGICVDGIWGTIKGLGTLVGFQGWDAMRQAWKGLAQLATGLAFMSSPLLGALFWATPDKYMPSWLRESRNTMKQTGKALLAWDEWGKNPARAAGGVTFNVLTTVFTGGEGAALAGAGKAGAVAKAISVAGKVGRIIDPMTYVMKGAGAGLSKIGDIAKGLKGIGKVDIPTLPDGSVHLPDGRLLEPNGNLLGHDGLPDTTPIPKEAAPGLPSHWTVPTSTEPVSVGVPHGAENGVHGAVPHVADSGVPAGLGHSPGSGLPAGAAHAPGGGIHGGMPHVPDNGVHGGMPHVPDNGIHGGMPHSPGSGIHGGMPASNGIHGGMPHSPGSGIHGGVPHGPGDGISAGGHAGTTPKPWYQSTPTTPAHDVPHTTPHDAPHTGGPTDHGPGHGGHGGAGHDGSGHDAGHGGLDHTGLGHDAADVGGHDGADAATPGHSGTDAPGHGAGEPFEYKPHMSDADFDNLTTDAERHAAATAELERGTNPWPSSSNAAGKAYGDAHWNDFLDNLDPKSKDALERYSSFYYKHINGQLRKFDKYGPSAALEPKVQELVDNMDRVMGDRPVPEDIMVVRGTDITHLELDSPLEMEGNSYREPGFLSTSLGKDAAFDYKPVILHLRVPKGAPALWIDHISVNKGERELLLARRTSYRVTRVFQDSTGQYHAYGEVQLKR
ncbi:ADP-ribosyltransferase, partial [Streptomyces sp. NPDC001393]